MERKANDLMMNMVANPQFSLADFATIGFNMNNTSLQEDPSIYKSNPFILKAFSDENGKFDEQSFQSAYKSAVIAYNLMATNDFGESQLKIFHRNDISAPRSMRREGPDFRLIVISNPDRTTYGIYKLGEEGPRSRSRDELAQANKVLLNPAEVYKNGDADWAKAQWGDSPNDSFWGYFTDTLVMAQWDNDGTHTDPVTGQTVQHKKGELKIGENGTYFYEKLDGRDIYGRRVLNKMNVLTTDGSKWNKYDFFDSDDIEQKSVGGTIMKNLALVGSMFIPYVGPWVTGASIATQMVGLMGTLGKMFTGSESPLFSEMEGWSKSFDRQTAKSEYAQEHPWAVENWISLVGDVAGLLKEQRFFFEKVPAIFKGGYAGSNKAYAKKLAEFEKAEKALTDTKLSQLKTLVENGEKTQFDLLRATQEWRKTEAIRALGAMDSWMKGYNKIGEIFSKGYMTAITVGDTYGEAKAAGASDLDATLLTLGYAAGEYAILNTGIGEWILPELRADRYKNKAIIKAITELNKEGKASWKDMGKAFTNFNKDAKKQYVKDVFNIGKNIAKGEYANGTRALKATAAAGLGEGVEEVSEELLADFSKGCFNVVKWLQGDETRLDSFGYQWDENGNRSWNGGEVWDRYGMSFFGGAIGGALTNAGTSYRMGKNLSNMTSLQAIQEIVYMARNNQLDSLYKTLDKMEIADKRMSATEFEQIGDQYIAKPGTPTNNLDTFAKRAVRQQIQLIDNILKAEGANLSDLSFLDALTEILGDLRFNALHNAATAGVFMLEFNTLSSEIATLVQLLNKFKNSVKDTNGDGKVSDGEARSATENEADAKAIREVETKLNEKRQLLKDLVEGKRADEFVGITLFEMNSNLHNLPVNFPMYVQKVTGKRILDITDSTEKEDLRRKYEAWMKSDGIDRIVTAAKVYMDMAKQSSSVINEHWNTYQNQTLQVKDINRTLINIYEEINDEYYQKGDTNPEAVTLKAKQLLNVATVASKIGQNVISDDINNIITWLNTELARIGAITDEAQKSAEKANLVKDFNNRLFEVIYNNFNLFLRPFVDLGFANADIKNQFKQIVDMLKVHNDYQLKLLEEQGVNDDTVDEDFITDDQRDAFFKYQLRKNEFNDFEDKIDDLKNTPFEENLNQFAISIGANPINYTGLIDRLDKIFNNLEGNLQDFNMEDDVLLELDNAIAVAEMYRQAINGAKVDNANLNDLFGYNKVMNLVSSKLGKELNLAEIDSRFADVLVADIDEGLNRLKFLRNLYSVNQGQKMVKQQRIAIKKDTLLFKGLKAIVSVKDDDEADLATKDAVAKFENVLNGLTLISDVATNKTYSLSDEQKVQFEREKIAMEDAIYELFLNINDNDLSRIIGKFDLYTLSEDLLNEHLEELDGPSMVWYLATRAAVKSSNFYEAFRSILDDKIIPIATQEMAVYSNYATLINGNVITKFFDAYRAQIKDDWKGKSVDLRIEVLKKLGKSDSDAAAFSDDKFADFCLNFLPVVRYSNVNLVEGAPGTGKSAAVMALTGRMLSKFHPELLKNVAYVHGANENSAKNLKESVGIDGKTFGITKFLEEIIQNYVPYEYGSNGSVKIDEKTAYTLNDENEIKGTHKLKATDNPFSVIFIDEVSKFNVYELDAINQYAKDHGITVITAGDFDLTGVIAEHPVTLNNQRIDSYSLELERNMFCRTPKLGVSMRTDNAIMTNDLTNFRTWMVSESKDPLKLHYYQNPETKELFGNKVIDSYNGVTDEVKEEILNMIDTLTAEEKAQADNNTDGSNGPIGFIYSDPNSVLYKYLHDGPLKKYFSFKEGGTAQGLEGRYYIIDASDKLNLSRADKREIYTGISRASQATLLYLHNNVPITSDTTNKLIKEPLGNDIRQLYIRERAKVLEEVVNGTVPGYVPRTGNKSQGTPSGTSIDDVINSLPDNIRNDVKVARSIAMHEPKTDNGMVQPTLNDSDFTYGDIVEWGDPQNGYEVGVIVGIGPKRQNGNRTYEVLRPTLKKLNQWGYETWPIFHKMINKVLYTEKLGKAPARSTFTIDLLAAKWGDKMRYAATDVEYNGRKGKIQLLPIHVEAMTPSGDIIDQNANIIDFNGEKIVLVKVENAIQPFVLRNNKWEAFDNINNFNITTSPLIEAISNRLGQVFGNNVNGTDLGPKITTATTNGEEIANFIKSNGSTDLLFSNWTTASQPISTPTSVTINEGGTNTTLNVGDKIYTLNGTLTITDIQENGGNKFIMTDGNKTYSLVDLLSKINNGLFSLHPFNTEKTAEIQISSDGTTHIFKKGDVFYLNGEKMIITKITDTNIHYKNEAGTTSVGVPFADFGYDFYINNSATLSIGNAPQIISLDNFNINELDFENNYYLVYNETEEDAKKIILNGDPEWQSDKDWTEDDFESKDEIIQYLLQLQEEANALGGSIEDNHIIILEIPKTGLAEFNRALKTVIPPKYIKTVIKIDPQPQTPSQTGTLDLNGTEVKVGDRVINTETNDEVQIMSFETNLTTGAEIVIVLSDSKSYQERFTLSDFLSKFTTKEPTSDESISIDNTLLKVGDSFYSNGNEATITQITPYQEGNPRVTYKFADGTEVTRTYKKLVKLFENGQLKLKSDDRPGDFDPLDDGDESSDSTLKNPGEDRRNLDDLSSNKTDPKLNKKPGHFLGVDMFLHSMNTFELGVLVDENGLIILDERWANKRIDSVNGLRRIDLIVNNRRQLRSVDYYKTWIGNLRSHILNATDMSDLCNVKLKRELGLDDLSIRFAFKASPVWKKGNDGYVASKPDPFGKHRGEKSYNNHSSDTRSGEVIPHSLVAIVKSNRYKDVLELPLLTLTSPITLAQITDDNGVPIYPVLYDVYRKYAAELDRMKQDPESFTEEEHRTLTYRMLREMQAESKKVPEYKHVSQLLELFLYSHNGFFEIPDKNWLPSKNLINLGSQFTTHKGDKHFEEGFDFNSGDEKDWIPIQDFADDKSIVVTPIMKVVSDTLTVNGIDRRGLVKAGHPFVLISYDKEINTQKKIIDQWLQQLDPEYDGIDKVRIQYIQTPSLESSSEYFEYLNAVYSEGKGLEKIRFKPGNYHTPYLILSTLLTDENPEFLEIARNRVILYDLLKHYIDQLNALETIEERHKFLKSTRKDINGNELQGTVGKFLGHSLQNIAYRKTIPTTNQLNGKPDTLDENVVKLVDKGLKRGVTLEDGTKREVRLYYWPTTKKTGSIGLFVNVDTDGFKINGKDCLLNGKIDTYMYLADMSSLLNYWASLIEYNYETANGIVVDRTIMQEGYYDIDNSIFEGKKPIITPPKVVSKAYTSYVKVGESLAARSNPKVRAALDEHLSKARLKENATDAELKNALLDIRTRLMNNGILAFVLNDRIVIPQVLNDSPLFRDSILVTTKYQGRDVAELSGINPKIDEVTIMNLDGTTDTYSATYNNGTLNLISLNLELTQSTPVTLSVTEDNVLEYAKGISTVLEKIGLTLPNGLKSNPAYFTVKRAIDNGRVTNLEELYDVLDTYSKNLTNQAQLVLQAETDPNLKLILQELINYNESLNPDNNTEENPNCPITIPIKLV